MEIISVLRDEHQQVMGLFEKFDGMDELSAKNAVAEEIIQQLMVHEKAEEDAVYSKVRQALPDPSVVDTAIQEQAILKERIRDLVSEADSERLVARMTEIRKLVMSHVSTEQNVLFPLMLQYVEEGRRDELAANFKTAKAGHMAEMPRLNITMVQGSPIEQHQRS